MVRESLRPGERVGEVARRYGISRWRLSTWRSAARRGELEVDVEWRIQVCMAGDRFDDSLGDVSRFVPMYLEPFLELRDLARTLNLDIQLDILRETRSREVAGTCQSLGTHDLELCVGDVGFGMEFVLVVDTAFHLPGA